MLLFSARLELTILFTCIPDRLDAHCFIVFVRYLLFCRSTLPVPSRSNQILFVNHNDNRFSESRIAIHQNSLVYLDQTF